MRSTIISLWKVISFTFYLLIGISFSNICMAAEEIEPNDSSAQQLALGETLTGTIASATDVDKYVVQATGPGSLTIDFGTEQINTGGMLFRVVDSSGTLLSSAYCSFGYDSCVNTLRQLSVGISASGSYIIEVVSNRADDVPNGYYTIKATYSDLVGGVEIEPNDTSAQQIALADTITGTIATATDVDKYVVQATGPGRLTIDFGTELNNTWGMLFRVPPCVRLVVASKFH